MKRTALALAAALLAASCATATPDEFKKVADDFAVLVADAAGTSLDVTPEYLALRDAIRARDLFAIWSAAVALGDTLKASPLKDDVTRLIADVRALFTAEQERAASSFERARSMR